MVVLEGLKFTLVVEILSALVGRFGGVCLYILSNGQCIISYISYLFGQLTFMVLSYEACVFRNSLSTFVSVTNDAGTFRHELTVPRILANASLS